MTLAELFIATVPWAPNLKRAVSQGTQPHAVPQNQATVHRLGLASVPASAGSVPLQSPRPPVVGPRTGLP